MLANLFTERTLRRIEDAIEANRAATALAVKANDGERLNQLNKAWYDLVQEQHHLTGQDPYPFRMRA